MEIRSLNYLKKIMHKGMRYEVVAHYRPEIVGKTCVVTMVAFDGFHSVICDDAGNAVDGHQYEKWSIWWLWASCWVFGDGLCTQYCSVMEHTEENFIATIRILE